MVVYVSYYCCLLYPVWLISLGNLAFTEGEWVENSEEMGGKEEAESRGGRAIFNQDEIQRE